MPESGCNSLLMQRATVLHHSFPIFLWRWGPASDSACSGPLLQELRSERVTACLGVLPACIMHTY